MVKIKTRLEINLKRPCADTRKAVITFPIKNLLAIWLQKARHCKLSMRMKRIKIARKILTIDQVTRTSASSACLPVWRRRKNSSSTKVIIDRAGAQTFFSSRERLKSRSWGDWRRWLIHRKLSGWVTQDGSATICTAFTVICYRRGTSKSTRRHRSCHIRQTWPKPLQCNKKEQSRLATLKKTLKMIKNTMIVIAAWTTTEVTWQI